MNPKWKLCGEGKQQSPIDISDKVVHFPQLGQLERDYKPARAVLKNSGHIIEMKWKGNAGQLNLNGTNYKLIQCHWHTPSEHTLNGTKFDLELHVVHQNSVGERAAIGIWYKIGDSDPLLSELLEKLKSLGDEDIDVGEINPGIIKFGSRYYRYDGSLTTPPCTEGVVWTIMKKVRTVSTEQLSALKGAIRHIHESLGLLKKANYGIWGKPWGSLAMTMKYSVEKLEEVENSKSIGGDVLLSVEQI
ncbi:unnamed protein product [Sphenostylis stenocarpa]|uniref:Carbonic anhydrase n=1 Tax=Sphenostylis stenocarpa TaxID=92480 RepID=A0AA86RRM3_9FABA|nr:unnamed protein product [Sphenostylis stenocarpa]